MLPITIDEMKDLMAQARALTKSGHPFLDAFWETEGADGRNACYRRPYYRFNQLLAHRTKPELIVELGIDEGVSCGHFAFGCPTAKVIGVDIHKDGEAPSVKCRNVAAAFPNFNYVRAWTWDGLKTIKALNKPIDILFIDSWHEFDYFARDWNDYSPLLRVGSLVLVDDLQMPEISTGFNQLPGEKYVDHTMNQAVPMGVMIYDGKDVKLTYKHRDFMP